MVSKKLHRFSVVDGANNLVTVATQSQILKLLHRNIQVFHTSSKKTIGDLKLGYREVQKVHDTQIAVEAFKTIIDNKVSGLAVVDLKGDIIGSISDAALLRITSDSLNKLWFSIHEFLDLDHSSGPVCVDPSTTIEELVKKIVERKIHRVYIVNEKNTILGVISLIDIIEFFANAEQ